jgi:hypothetical protein
MTKTICFVLGYQATHHGLDFMSTCICCLVAIIIIIIIVLIIIIIIYHPFIGSKMQITPLECLVPSTNTDYDFTFFE